MLELLQSEFFSNFCYGKDFFLISGIKWKHLNIHYVFCIFMVTDDIYCTIRVKRETKDRLKELGKYGDTMDGILVRLIDGYVYNIDSGIREIEETGKIVKVEPYEHY